MSEESEKKPPTMFERLASQLAPFVLAVDPNDTYLAELAKNHKKTYTLAKKLDLWTQPFNPDPSNGNRVQYVAVKFRQGEMVMYRDYLKWKGEGIQ